MDITILELSFPDAEFNAPFSNQSPPGKRAKNNADDADNPAPATQPSLLRPIIIGLTLVGLAVLAKYIRKANHTATTD